jgi:chromosome segregation ATPase
MNKYIVTLLIAVFLVPSFAQAHTVDVMALLRNIQELYGKQVIALQAQIVEKDKEITDLKKTVESLEEDGEDKEKNAYKFKREIQKINNKINSVEKKLQSDINNIPYSQRNGSHSSSLIQSARVEIIKLETERNKLLMDYIK